MKGNILTKHASVEPAYPSQYETEVLRRDGSRIFLRPIKYDDIDCWLTFVHGLSPHSMYLRFHNIPADMNEEDAERFCTVDYNNSFAIVAEVLGDKGKDIIAIGRYYRLPGKRSAEVAFVIADDDQAKGIGTLLLGWLAKIAHDNGITVFEADVLAENHEMMTVLSDYGFHITSTMEAGVYHVVFPIGPTPRVLKKEEERERISTLASLKTILEPSSVAVVGASRRVDSIGYAVLRSLVHSGYSGVVYPVNPNTDAVMSIKSYPSITDIPAPVDMAVIIVPAAMVNRAVDECGRKGVRSVIVISDGFRERGAEGIALERELRDNTLGHGMRLVGPNCMGVINTNTNINLNASFSRVYPPKGNVAFLSQSGAMGLVILEHASELNMGISTFVSVGNRSDISSNDLLQYWEHDPATDVILLYLESFGNPRKFARIARRVSKKKPIVVVKSGSTSAGSRAASSHTGSMATSEVVSDALFQQAGMIKVDSMEELFDVAALLSNEPIPQGRRLVIVTNGGGPGIIAADAAEHQGLILPELSEETVARLRSVISRDLALSNPLDLTAGVGAAELEKVLKILAEDEDNDAVLAMFIAPAVTAPEPVEAAIRGVSPVFRRHKKTYMTCSMGRRGVQGKPGSGGKVVPAFLFPEAAITALSHAVRYAEVAREPVGKTPRIPGIKRTEARKVIDSATMRNVPGSLWLSTEEISVLLDCYGIRSAKTVFAQTPDEAAAMAKDTGFPVVVKLSSAQITHKTDVGGVFVDLKSEEEVRKAFEDIRASLAAIGREDDMDGVTIQPFVKGGIETIVGVTQDPSFGPLIMFGLGGIYAELLKDVAIKLHPLTDKDAGDLIKSVKMGQLLKGYRGSAPADIEALEDLLLRLSAMVEDIPEIAELDFNPVLSMPRGEGYWVVDARILIK